MSATILSFPDGRRWNSDDDLFEAYTEFLIGEGYAPRTIDIKRLRLRQVLEHAREMGVDLDTASPSQVAGIANRFPYTTATRNQVRGALRDYWEMIERPRAPVKAVRSPRKPKMVTRSLEPDEARRLVDVSRGEHPEGTAVLLGLYLALRVSEIARARWSAFEDDFAWCLVQNAKGGSVARLPVHPTLGEHVRALVAPPRCECHHPSSPWMFPGSRGRAHVSEMTITNWVHKMAARAEVPNITTHRLRHTALTTANDQIGDLRAVSEFARHASIETTKGYTRTTRNALERVRDALEY